MKGLGKYRIIHCIRYNSRAERNSETWIVEELTKTSWLTKILFRESERWCEHREWVYDSKEAIKFKELTLANEYVERLLSGNPRDTVIKTVVSEIE